MNPLQGTFEISDFATYQLFSIDVGIGNPPPVGGDISMSWECPGDPCPGFIVTFSISEAYDPSGLPITIKWDFDGNLDFVDDIDGDDTNLSGEYKFPNAGSYDAWCRIDNSISHTDIGPFDVNVIDCTPDSPIVVKTISTTVNNNARKMDYDPEKGFAYIIQDTGSSGSVSIMDVSDPSTAYEVKLVPLSAWSATIAYHDGHVYAAGQAMQGIVTIDVDPPANASIVNTWTNWSMTGSMEDMMVQGNYLYVAAQWGGFMIFDVTNPANPTLVGRSPTTGPRYTISVAVTPDAQWGFFHQGYSDATTDLTVALDISNPASPFIVDSIEMPTFAMDMQVKGDYLFAVSHPWWGRTLAVMDITDPSDLSIVTTYQLTNGAWDIDIDGDYLYAPAGELTIADISDPMNPFNLVTPTIHGEARGVRVHCGYAYVSSTNTSDLIRCSIVDLY